MNVVNISVPLLSSKMERSLDVCHSAMRNKDMPSLAVIDTFQLYNNHVSSLEPHASRILDRLFDIALHYNAVMGTRDQMHWSTDDGMVTRKTLPSHTYEPGTGDEECKQASRLACSLIDRVARTQPEAFTSDHVSDLLRLTGYVERNAIPADQETPMHETITYLARKNHSAFTVQNISLMGERHRKLAATDFRDNEKDRMANAYKFALNALLLKEEPPEPKPGPMRDNVVHVTFSLRKPQP